MNNKFKGITAAVFLIGLTFLSGTNGFAAKQVTLRLAYATGTSHSFHTAGLKFSEVVKEKSRGEMVVELFPGGALGWDRDVNEGLQLGTIDLSAGALATLAFFVPEMSMFEFPFIAANTDHFLEIVRDPIVTKRLTEAAATKSFIMLGFSHTGIRDTINRLRPVRTPEDFKGMKIRLIGSPLHIAAYKQFGATGISMAWTEVYSAVQTGAIDGFDNHPGALSDAHAQDVAKYLTILNLLAQPAGLAMSKAIWGKLNPKQQNILTEAGKEWVSALDRATVDKDKTALVEMAKAGVQIITEVDRGPFIELVKPLYTHKYLSTFPEWQRELILKLWNQRLKYYKEKRL